MGKAKAKTEDTESAEHKLLVLAEKQLKKAVQAVSHDVTAAIADLKFANGDEVWNGQEVQDRDREGRPHLQIDLIAKNVSQLVGEERQNSPRIEIKAVDNRATVRLATLRKGIVANIEYLSDADIIYSQGYEQMLECAFGAWRVNTRDCEENPFLKEIFIEPIENPLAVKLDPSPKREYGFIVKKMSKSDFDDEFPNATTGGEQIKAGIGISNELYYDRETVVVAEYFRKMTRTIKMCQLEDGTVLKEDEAEEVIKEWEEDNKEATGIAQIQMAIAANNPPPPQPPMPQQGQTPPGMPQPQPGMPPAPPQGVQGQPPPPAQPPAAMPQPSPEAKDKPRIVKRKDTEETYVKHWLITGAEILAGEVDGEDVPGKHIPIVQIKGRQRNIEGKNYTRSFIRPAKDPQKLYNYWITSAAEVVAGAPKAPWLATSKMIEGHEDEYALSGQKNTPFLLYEVDPELPPGSKPERVQPAIPPVAMFTLMGQAQQNVRETLGMFAADVGDVGPERTGEAVRQRQKPGDIGAFPFFDNLLRGIRFTGQIVNDMIPEIYDTERDIRVRNVDGTDSFIPINTTPKNAIKMFKANPERYHGMDLMAIKDAMNRYGPDSKFNDMSVGKYEVVVKAGPSYATQREETAEKLTRIFQAAPQAISAIGLDVIIEHQDLNGAEKELGKRFRKTLRPGLADPRPDEPPAPPSPIPPQMQLLLSKSRTEEIKQQKELLKAKLELLKIEKEMQESKAGMRKEAMDLLAEIHAPEHPADGIALGMDQQPQQKDF